MAINNRKGFLLAEETLKMVIALICIMFLVYFLGALYFNSKADKDLNLAKASLDNLIKQADSFGSEGGTVEIYNPGPAWDKGIEVGVWYVVSFKTGNLPNLCSNKGWEKCICICKGDESKDCDTSNEGYCVKSDYTVSNPIGIKNPLPVKLNINDGVIS